MSILVYCIPRAIKMQFFVLIFPQKNTPKGDTNRQFHVKHTKYLNFCIMKNTAEISSKLYTMMATTNYPLWVVRNVPQKFKMADVCHFYKRKNCYIWATIWLILMKMVWWCTLAFPAQRAVKNSKIIKSNNNYNISKSVWLISTIFCMVRHIHAYWPFGSYWLLKNSDFHKFKMACGCHFESR